jgi:hypothetical protein
MNGHIAGRSFGREWPIKNIGQVRTHILLKSSGAMDLARVPPELRRAPSRPCLAGHAKRYNTKSAIRLLQRGRHGTKYRRRSKRRCGLYYTRTQRVPRPLNTTSPPHSSGNLATSRLLRLVANWTPSSNAPCGGQRNERQSAAPAPLNEKLATRPLRAAVHRCQGSRDAYTQTNVGWPCVRYDRCRQKEGRRTGKAILTRRIRANDESYAARPAVPPRRAASTVRISWKCFDPKT